MANIKKIGMAAGTFSVALGIGFVMQNGDALASRFGADSTASAPAPFTAETVETAVVIVPVAASTVALSTSGPAEDPVAPQIFQDVEIAQAEMVQEVPQSTAPSIVMPEPVVSAAVILPEAATIEATPEAPVQLATLDPDLALEPAVEPITAEPIDCVPTMVGVAGAVATVKVAVTAPCHTDEAFTVHHQGMMFTMMTDADGRATVSIPALAEVAVVIAAFENGDGAVATSVVPDFANFDRAVLQWQGEAAVMLSAYEGDANFGESGHIHVGNPGDMARLNNAEGGFLMQLGDASVEDALVAEVYTFPSGMDAQVSGVMLIAEAEITNGNCGQDLSAQSIQVFPTGETAALDLTLTMPDCDAVGDILILQNMFEDLTLAMR